MRQQTVTSPANRLIREAVEVRDRRSKALPDRVFVEGPRLIETALASGAALERLFYTKSFAVRREGRALLMRAEKAVPPELKEQEEQGGTTPHRTEVTDRVMSLLSGTVTPQGVAAIVVRMPAKLDSLALPGVPLLVVCDGIQDPGNLGAIIRTADAAGADAVAVLPGTCDPLGGKTIRSTAGSIFNVPVIACAADELIGYVTGKGFGLYVTDSRGTVSLYDAVLTGPVALAFGSEAQGASREIRAASRESLRVPIYGRAESLNVATAAAVCLYEAVRQRKPLPKRNSLQS